MCRKRVPVQYRTQAERNGSIFGMVNVLAGTSSGTHFGTLLTWKGKMQRTATSLRLISWFELKLGTLN